jgi:hypothetical protein
MGYLNCFKMFTQVYRIPTEMVAGALEDLHHLSILLCRKSNELLKCMMLQQNIVAYRTADFATVKNFFWHGFGPTHRSWLFRYPLILILRSPTRLMTDTTKNVRIFLKIKINYNELK